MNLFNHIFRNKEDENKDVYILYALKDKINEK